MPVLRLQRALRTQPEGAIVRLYASDPLAEIDVPHFCQEAGHHLTRLDKQVGQAPAGGDLLIFEIRRGGAPSA